MSNQDRPIIFLKGQRISLRPIRIEDSPHYERWLNDAEISKTLNVHQPLTHCKEVQLLEELAKMPISKGFVLGIWLDVPQVLIGNIGIHDLSPRDQHAMLGLFIGEKRYWGQGYAREACQLALDYAFSQLNLRKVWLFHNDNNPRARQLYLRLGFEEVGRFREHTFSDGAFRDVCQMELFRDRYWSTKEAGQN